MKSLVSGAVGFWRAVLVSAMVFAPGRAVLAQQSTGEEQVGGRVPRDADVVRDVADGVPRTARRIGEVVNVFSSTEVSPNERASSVVTVWGDTRVEGEVGGDCVTVFGNAVISGDVGGECVTVFGDLDLNGRVRGEVVVVLGNARFGPNAVVEGECIVVGGRITADREASFYRQKREFASFLPPLGSWFKYGLLFGRPLVPSLGWVWVVFFLHALVYLMVALLVPKPVEACERALREQPLGTFGVGLLGLFLFWPAVIVVGATGVGLLVIPFLLIAGVAAFVLGKTATLQWLGRSSLRAFGRNMPGPPLLSFLAGIAIVAVLYLMPVLGLLVWGLMVPLAFGAALMALVELLRQQRAKRPPAPLVRVPAETLGSPPPRNPAPDASTAGAVAGADVGAASGLLGTPAPSSSWADPAVAGSTAELTALPRAGFWIRFAATLLDLLLLGWFLRHVDGYFPLLWIAYHVGLWTWKGTTIGGIVCGLKIVREDGRRLDFTVALVRSLASVFSFVALGLGFFWVGWSPERQSWHDKIAGTVIVKVPKGISLI